jgi:uncharacterized protein (TIGR03437 family)
VLGQASFTTSFAGIASASSLKGPSSVAIGPGGEVFVADTADNRVLQFAPNPVTGAAAIQVYGQSNFSASAAPGAITPQTLSAPRGVFVDPAYNLYVADSGANRVVVYSNIQSNPANGRPAQVVFGQGRFDSGGSGSGAANLNGPLDVAVDGASLQYSIYVSDSNNGRVLVFPSLVSSAQQGQAAATGLTNASCTGVAANSLCAPAGLFLDRKSTLYVADALNSRVVHFLKSSVVVNAASFASSVPLAPGSAAAFGTVPNVVAQASTGAIPLPLSLSGVQIVVNDASVAPLYSAGNYPAGAPTYGQVNFQVPSATPSGANRIAMRDSTTGELIAGGILQVANSGPALFSANSQGTGQGSILNQDGATPNGAGHAAPRGSVVSLFGTGQGATSPAAADAQGAPGPPQLALSNTVAAADPQGCLQQAAVCVVFGNSVFGTVQFSGLAPGFVGLWQINVQIPSNAPTGSAVSLYVVLGGIRSNSVTMAIQ